MNNNNPISKLNGNVTLVLNSSYIPLAVCSSKRALCLYFLDKIDIIHNYNDYVHSPSMKVRIPSVVKLKRYVKHNNLDVVLNRKNLLIRDNFSCQYCLKKFSANELTFDHLTPRCMNGKTTWENVVSACTACNLKKGRRLLKFTDMNLLKHPIKPNSIQLQNNGRNFPPNFLHKSWRDYLYWDVELIN